MDCKIRLIGQKIFKISKNHFFNDVDNWKNITNSQHSVRKKSFGGTFTFSNCHIIGLDNGSLVLIVFAPDLNNNPLDNYINPRVFVILNLQFDIVFN
jgi:hypothetical protein